LQPKELLNAAQGLHVIAYEDGMAPSPQRRVQRLAAWRPSGADAMPPSL
jgi:hypothetical protein